MTVAYIDGVPVPPNDGDLPLDIEHDTDPDGNTITRIRIAWHGYTIRQQFPWTRSVGET